MRPLEVAQPQPVLLLADEEEGGHVVLALDEDLAALLELVPLAQGVHAPLAHLNENEGNLPLEKFTNRGREVCLCNNFNSSKLF